MCTSFVMYAEQTYIGMNFDISERPIKLCLKQEHQFLVLQKEGSTFFPAFGLTRSGTFMNLLMVDPHEKGHYRRGKHVLHIMKLFEDILNEHTPLTMLPALLQETHIVNVPHQSVHSLVAGKERQAYVIEPGRSHIPFNSETNNFMVLTNFPLSDFQHVDYADVQGGGAERYKICYRRLKEAHHAFDVDDGFSILQETSQADGNFPTQLSVVAVPEEERIYFSMNRAFDTRFVFAFQDSRLHTTDTSSQQQARILNKKGLLLSQLEQ